MHPMFFQPRHFDTLAFVGDARRDDIMIEGGRLRGERAELYCGPGAELPVEQRVNVPATGPP